MRTGQKADGYSGYSANLAIRTSWHFGRPHDLDTLALRTPSRSGHQK
ncbi:MAG: hypothetical protein R6U28_00870 [Cyclonatronaceae bacterium]